MVQRVNDIRMRWCVFRCAICCFPPIADQEVGIFILVPVIGLACNLFAAIFLVEDYIALGKREIREQITVDDYRKEILTISGLAIGGFCGCAFGFAVLIETCKSYYRELNAVQRRTATGTV